MNKDYLTIKEVSSAVDRSYQNIYQRTKTTLKKYVVVIDGKTYLKSDVLKEFNISSDEEVFKEQFKAENKADLNSNLNDNLSPLHQSNEEELKELIEELRAEVKRKDEIIVSKDEQLKKQTEEILQLSNRVVELFENSQKLQLQTSFLLSDKISDRNDEHELRPSDEIIEEIKPKRKSLFKRLFK